MTGGNKEEYKRDREEKAVISGCDCVVELSYHLWWCGLHGAMAKLEREITIVVVVRGDYGLLEIIMIF